MTTLIEIHCAFLRRKALACPAEVVGNTLVYRGCECGNPHFRNMP